MTDGWWFACECPERPPSLRTSFHVIPECKPCAIVMQAVEFPIPEFDYRVGDLRFEPEWAIATPVVLPETEDEYRAFLDAAPKPPTSWGSHVGIWISTWSPTPDIEGESE